MCLSSRLVLYWSTHSRAASQFWDTVEEGMDPPSDLHTISTIRRESDAMADGALILVVEDDGDIARILAAYLERDSFRTVRAGDGEMALHHHLSLKPDLVLLDVNLPKLDGFAVIAELRRRGDTPVIFLTALADDIDKLTALRIGADDYVVKPFNPAEVVARVKAVLRRQHRDDRSGVLRVGRIELDLQAHIVRVALEDGPTPLNVTLSEFRILAQMMRAPSRVFSRAELLDKSLPDSEALERTVDSHVSNLRRKLEAVGASGLLTGVRGVGYRLQAEL
jgi:two-component system, OmpR family, response regulator AdeR